MRLLLSYNQVMSFDIKHVAKLAALTLTDEEAEKFEKQLAETAEHIDNLNEVNTEGIEPTSQVTGLENIAREDVITPSLTQEQALMNAKSTYNGFFKVKGILSSE